MSSSKKIIVYGSMAAAIGAMLTLVFTLFPDIKPEPRRPPAKMGAELNNLLLDSGVTLADYLRATGLPADRFNPTDPSHPGWIIHFTAKISGFRGMECSVRGTVYDAQTSSRLFDLTDARYFTPDADEDSAGSELWVPSPGRNGSFFVRLKLYDPRGTPLTYADSKVFDVEQ